MATLALFGELQDRSSEPVGSAPKSPLALYANRPNPFNPVTAIPFSLAAAGPVDLAVYDVRDRLVKRLDDGVFSAGAHEVQWKGRNRLGEAVASGVYFYKLVTGGREFTKRMILLSKSRVTVRLLQPLPARSATQQDAPLRLRHAKNDAPVDDRGIA